MANISIEISRENVYNNGTIISYSDTEHILQRQPITIAQNNRSKKHILQQGETLDLLAWQYYNSESKNASSLWWIIAEANNIIDSLDIAHLIGKTIIIPDLNDVYLLI